MFYSHKKQVEVRLYVQVFFNNGNCCQRICSNVRYWTEIVKCSPCLLSSKGNINVIRISTINITFTPTLAKTNVTYWYRFPELKTIYVRPNVTFMNPPTYINIKLNKEKRI